MRAFTEEQLSELERSAPEEVGRLCGEVRRCYAAEDAAAGQAQAITALLSATFQQIHGAARTLESAIRMCAPPQGPVKQVDEPQRKRPRVLMDEQLA